MYKKSALRNTQTRLPVLYGFDAFGPLGYKFVIVFALARQQTSASVAFALLSLSIV